MKTKGLLVLCAILLSLAMIEGFLRIQDFYLSQSDPESREEELWRYDDLLGWRHRENMTVTFSSKRRGFKAVCTTNSHGLRDEEYSYQKPKGTLRILLLGDSGVVGMEVEKGKVIDSVLEGLIRSKRPCEIINAGVRGYGTDQSYLYLIHEGIRYDPDIVLYVFVGNDPEDNITIHRPRRKYGKPYFVLENDALILKGIPVPRTFVPNDRWLTSYPRFSSSSPARSFVAKMKSYFQKHSLLYREAASSIRTIKPIEAMLMKIGLIHTEAAKSFDSSVLEYRWQMTRALIQAMKEFCDRKGVRYAVFEFTEGIEGPSSQKTPIQKITEELGVNLIESRDVFFKESKGTKKFCFQKDPHWSAEGHALSAKIIFGYLQKRGWF